jgi:hypothetical protein
MAKTKTIAVVDWLMNEVGGINSYCENIIEGLRMNDYDVTHYYVTKQIKLGCDPDKKVKRGGRCHLLPALHLSYRPEFIQYAIDELNRYDFLLFIHPSPHPTKGNMDCDYPENWKKLYQETTPRKLVMLHDRHWDRTNKWFGDVAEHVDFLFAAQKHFCDAANRYPADIPKFWDYFPLNLNLTKSTLPHGIVATQWIRSKNHNKVVPLLSQIHLPLKFYGSGSEYYTIRAEGGFEGQLGIDYFDDGYVYNSESPHNFYGYQEYHEVLGVMSQCRYSIDLSYAGMTNMTHWEPMTVGTVSVMEERTANDPTNVIPEDCFIAYPLSDFVGAMNELYTLPDSELEPIRQAGWKFVQDAAKEKVAKRIMEFVDENIQYNLCGD